MGVLQYAFGRGGKANDKKTGERKSLWRSPASVFLLTFSALLVFWFSYTVIADAVVNGVQTVLDHAIDFFALAVCLVIVIMSIGKYWSRFARFALRHNLVRNGERASVESSAEMMEEVYEKSEKAPPVFEVYENYIRATDGDAVKIFDRAHVAEITAHESHGQCYFSIEADGECVSQTVWLFDVNLSMREVKKLQAVLGDKLSVEPLKAEDGKEGARASVGKVNWVVIVLGLIAVVAGGGVIALHYTLAGNVPVALGALFTAGGVLIALTGVSSVPVVKVFVIPLLFGGIMLTVPWQFCKLIVGKDAILQAFSGLDIFLRSFNALYCATAFLGIVGLTGVISAVYGLIKYIKYGEY